MTLVMDNVPLGQSHYDICYGQCTTGIESLWHFWWTMCHWDRVIMTSVMDNVPLGQSHYDTCYGQCATGTETLWHLLWTMSHWDRVFMTLAMDSVPLGQSHYDTCYGQCPTGTESLWHLLWTVCHWDRHYLFKDKVPLQILCAYLLSPSSVSLPTFQIHSSSFINLSKSSRLTALLNNMWQFLYQISYKRLVQVCHGNYYDTPCFGAMCTANPHPSTLYLPLLVSLFIKKYMTFCLIRALLSSF